MPPDEPTHREIYDLIMDRLGGPTGQSVELAQAIRATVARGAVVTEQQTAAYTGATSTINRSMSDQESLAIALEFLVTAAEVPVMLARVRQTLDC